MRIELRPPSPVRELAFLLITLAGTVVPCLAHSFIPGCGDGSPVFLTNFVYSNSLNQGATVAFDISGGNAGIWYEILRATKISGGSFANMQWTPVGQGRPCDTCVLTNQPASGAFYALLLPTVQNSGSVYLTNMVANSSPGLGSSVSFNVAGGQSNVLYNLLATTNLFADPEGLSDWAWVGQGFARKTYNFSHQPPAGAFYAVGPAPATFVIGWGDNSFGQCDAPSDLTNAVAVTGGAGFSLALRADGTVTAWGDETFGQTDVPFALNYVTAIAAGSHHALALRGDGTVVSWGVWWNGNSYPLAQVPAGLSNVVAIAAGNDHDVALKADGSVVTWGASSASYNTVPTNLPASTAIAAGWNHNVALQASGSVRAWGINGASLGWNLTTLPPGLSNVVGIAAGALHTLAVRGNGTVAAWGYNADGQINVPPGLSNVVALAAGEKHSLALKRDGTVVAWGGLTQPSVLSPPAGLAGVTAIGAGANHCLAIGTVHSVPILTEQPVSQVQYTTGSATFDASALTAGAVSYQWQLNGTNITGATNATLTVNNLSSSAQGNYRVVIKNAAGSATTSNATLTLLPLPPPNVTAWTQPTNEWVNSQNNLLLSMTVSNPPGVPPASCSWQFNGADIFPNQASPYDQMIYEADPTQEGTYTAIISNAAGIKTINWSVQVANPGGIALWGSDDYGQSDRPFGLNSNVIAVAAGQYHSLALLSDGTVRKWGYPWAAVPANLSNAVAIAAGYSHSLALRNNGTVVAWGAATNAAAIVPANLNGVTAIAAGWNHSLALLSNGTVTAWGVDGAVLGWHLTEVPPGLSNVSAIAAGALHSLALRSDGTVVGWGYSPDGETNVPAGLSGVVAISAGKQHSLALKSDGTVVAWGFNGSGQCSVPAGLNNVIAVSAGGTHSVAIRNDGTIVGWGDNSVGQSSFGTNLVNVKCISAGGYHTLAAVYSPQLPYAVDASKDLLLVCNTNSPDSVNVLNYYLQHRPMVANASVLRLGCTNGETIAPADYTNQIQSVFTGWLAANPARRPAYVVLFLDVPSRVNPNGYSLPSYPSVSYQIANNFPNWHPFVTHINMGDTNACFAYIDKLAAISAANSPGRVVISAGAGGYGNSNYVIDNIRHGSGYADNYGYVWWLGSGATNGLLQNGVPLAGINWTNGTETISNGVPSNLPHLTNAANLAGYFCWGAHSSLGAFYAANGPVHCQWSGHSAWYIVETVESYNGQRYETGQGNFLQWFAPAGFGGTNYSNTPVGAVTTVDEPGFGSVQDPKNYFGLWAAGCNFGTCVWSSVNSPYVMAVGDPLVRQ